MYNRLLKAREARRDESGFTLIELLIVIVILGVLAGIVVFSVKGITDRGDVAACKSNVSTVNTAVEAFYAKNKSYPKSASDLTGSFLADGVPAGVVTAYDTTGAGAPTVKTLASCG